MFEEKYNELSLGEKNQFGSIVNTILLKGFIVRDIFDPKEKIIKISPTYRFIEKNYELINSYLSFANWRIEKDTILGVVALLNENNENHFRLDRETSLLIFTLRLIYETERDQSSSTSEAIYLTTQSLVRTMLEHGILLPNKKLTGRNLAKSLRFLVQHNILNKVSPSGYKQFKNGKQFSLHYYNLLKLHLLEKQYKVNFADYETFSVNKGSALLKKSNNENDLLIMDRDDYKMYKKVYKR